MASAYKLLKETNVLNLINAKSILEDTLMDDQFLDDIRMKIVKNYVKKYHENVIWQGSTDKRWYTKVPIYNEEGDVVGKKKIAKKSEDALYQALYDIYHEHFDALEKDEKPQSELTMIDLYDDWLASKSATRQSTTVHRLDCDWKKYYLNEPISESIINIPICHITANTIEAWANILCERKMLNKKTYYNLAAVIKGILKYAVKEQIIAFSPYRDIEITKALTAPEKPQTTQVYQIEKAKRLIRASYEEYFETKDIRFLMFPFLFYVGVRIGEALAINIHESIDLQKQTLHISRMCARHDRLVNGVWKTNEFSIVDRLKKDAPGRDVPLNSDAIELIKLIYRHYEERNMNPDYLFVLDDGSIPKQNNVRSMLERFCHKKFDAPDTPKEDRFYRSFHKMRKTYGSLLHQQGIHMKTVSEILGHRQESTTAKFYCYDLSSTDEIKKEVVGALSEFSIGDVSKFEKEMSKSSGEAQDVAVQKVV